MSRRGSRRTAQRPNEAQPPESAEQRRSALPLVATVFGLLLVCIGVLVLELTGRTLLFWLARDDYIRTEVTVTDVLIDSELEVAVWGIVAATGKEVRLPSAPTELHVYDSPSDATGELMEPSAARGKVIPIWFAEDHTSFFSSSRVHFVSEYDTPPSGTLVLSIAAVNLAILAVGAWCTAYGFRRALRRMDVEDAVRGA